MNRTSILAFSIFLAATAFAGPARADLRIVTTTTDLAAFARAVGGNHVDVDSICRGNQDPHYVQARPSYMVTVSRADLVIAVGLDLEVGWLPLVIQGARNPDVNPGRPGYLDASEAIVPIDVPTGQIDRSRGDLHPFGNPHYWLDPENAKLIAAAIAQRLTELDPEHGADYQQNLEAFDQRIDTAMARWRGEMAPYAGTEVATYHQTFNYFFDRFGLEGIGYIEERPGIPPGPSHLASLIRRMQADDIHVIFHENYYEEDTTRMVARRTDAHVLVLPTSVGGADGVDSYEALIDYIIDEFVGAMNGRSR